MEIDRSTPTADRSQDHFPGSSSSRKVNEEEREAITGRITGLIASVADSPSNCTEGDKPPLRSFYMSSNDHSSASSTCPLSSSTPNQMAVSTLHSYSSSSTESDSTTLAPPMVVSSPAPPAAQTRDSLSKPKVPCLPRGEYLKAEGDGLAKLIPGSGGKVGVKTSAGKKSPKSVSRLCFPFVMTTPKGKDKDRKLVPGAGNVLSASASAVPVTPAAQLASTSPHHHKYSCAPTRFCPFPIRRVALVQKHQRHAYTNRGYSHEALGYVKWFWGVRREGLKSGGKPYLEKEPHVARTVHPGPTHSTQSSMSELSPASTRATASVPTSCTETAPDLSDEKTIPASIHPRCGDISALRDPLCVEVDRTFGALGVWTLAKMVWMFELDVGMRKWKREQGREEQRRRSWLRVRILWDEERDGEGSLDSSTRSTSLSSLSDDSETTLVEDDSLSSVSFLSPFSSMKEEDCSSDEEDADDRLQLVIRGRQFTSQAQSSVSSSRSSTSRTPSASPGRKFDLDLDKSNIGRFVPPPVFQTRVEVSKLTGDGYCQHEWATDWMSRWDIIRNLLHSRS